MDGFDPRVGVVIMAATNRPETLDPALLRAGRFDRQVLVDKPDMAGREAILRVHAQKIVLSEQVDLAVIARKTPGFSGADLANVINEAALLAARRDKNAVDMEDLEEAVDRLMGGLEKKNRVINPKEKKVVAYHETGHALAATFTLGSDAVHKISIVPRGIGALGWTQQLPTEDRYLMTRTELLGKIDVLLGGRAAERLVFGEVSTGAHNDLQRATDIAWAMAPRGAAASGAMSGFFFSAAFPVLSPEDAAVPVPVPSVPAQTTGVANKTSRPRNQTIWRMETSFYRPAATRQDEPFFRPNDPKSPSCGCQEIRAAPLAAARPTGLPTARRHHAA